MFYVEIDLYKYYVSGLLINVWGLANTVFVKTNVSLPQETGYKQNTI